MMLHSHLREGGGRGEGEREKGRRRREVREGTK